MKNMLSPKALAEAQFNELFNHLFASLVIGVVSGWLLFSMNPIEEKRMIVLLGFVIGIASVFSVKVADYRSAGMVFAYVLPMVTFLVCIRLGINTFIPFTDNLLFFSQGFFPILLIGAMLLKLDRWGTRIIQEDKGYGGMPTPPFE